MRVEVSVRNRWLLVIGALVIYAVLWLGWVQQWAWLGSVDATLLAAGRREGIEDPAWVQGWQLFCTVFGPSTIRVVGMVVAVVAVARRQLRTGVFLLVSVGLSGVLTEIAKNIAHRTRPLTALAHQPSWSFPSGHALGSMVGLLGLTTAVLLLAPQWRRGIRIAAALGAVVVLLVGIGRVLLNVHYPSDVAAGWLLGGAWFLVTSAMLPTGPDLPGAPGRRAGVQQIVSKP